MSTDWTQCKNIVCIRPDNMGDVIMCQPAIRALKEADSERTITLLTSHIGAKITPFMLEIDATITFDFPWVKTSGIDPTSKSLFPLTQTLKDRNFDAAVLFTSFSQSALPAAVICLLADIPKRLAYARENVYQLLTDWVPDTEPFSPILHGVERNLHLVAMTGAKTVNKKLSLKIFPEDFRNALSLLYKTTLDFTKPWIIFHSGVEDEKRQFPLGRLAESAQLLMNQGYQILLTGTEKEQHKIHQIHQLLEKRAINLAGKLSLGEYLALVRISPLVIANNTGVIHMAAALNTPVLVLYARTNPEHTPWKAKSSVIYFDVQSHLKSKTPLLSYTNPTDHLPLPKAVDIANAALSILSAYTHAPQFQFL